MSKAREIVEKAMKANRPLSYKDLREMAEDTEANIAAALLSYYSSDKGMQEIANSPYAGTPPVEIVKSLLEEIRVLKEG